MSRVDEALRRAAEQPGGGPASTEPRETDGLEPLEAAALAREPFPIEMPERRHTRSGSLPIAAPTPMPVPDFPAQAPDGPTKTPGLTSVLETPSMTDRMSTALSEKIVIDQQISPASREQYRRLAATLHHAQARPVWGQQSLAQAAAVHDPEDGVQRRTPQVGVDEQHVALIRLAERQRQVR